MIAVKIALRELRGGLHDFRLFLSCLMIGVAVISGVGSVSRHIEQGIRHESKTLLGGDVELAQINARLTPEQLAFVQQYGRVSLSVTLRAMSTFGEQTALVELKGIDGDYPLLGEAQLGSGKSLHEGMNDNGIIVEQALLDRLDAKVGDTITLGSSEFHISDTLRKEPDSITNPLSLGPRVLADIDALEKQNFLLPAGLIRYHYHMLLSDPTQLEPFKLALSKQFPDAPWIVKTANDNNRNIQDFIGRLQLFMTLAGLSALLIGGIGIMNATDAYLSRKSETIAVMKTLGAKRDLVFTIFVTIIFIIALAGSFLGAVFGAAIASFSLPYLATFLPVFDTHFTLDVTSLLLAMAYGVLTVFTFCVASLGRGVEVRPALLFRGLEPSRSRLSMGRLIANILLAVALILVLLLSASDRTIAMGFIGSTLVSLLIFTVASDGIKVIAKYIHPPTPWARIAVANLYRPHAHTLSILLSTGIGLTVLIALLQVEGNFQKEVNETMPAVAPSLFLIDIQPAQKDEYLTFLKDRPYISDVSCQPMIRGRLSKLKGVPVEQLAIRSDAKWAVENDRGLTYATTPPANTRITEGKWWPEDYQGKTLVSLDKKLAKSMGIGIGDTITVNVLGQEIEAEIANLRDINYISFQINFAMIFSPGIIEHLPSTYIATVRIDNDANEVTMIRESAKQFPSISSIRIKDSIIQIRELIDHIAMGLRLCALVTLISGALVLATALSATLDKRIYDTVILKVLGARRADIIKMFLTEWLLLAVITSLISCVLGSAGAWLILKQLGWIEFQLIPKAIASTIGLALALITFTGMIIQSGIFNVRASTVLRNE